MRFIADNTVGKLRRWMSLLGYDVVYDPRSAREILRESRPPDSGVSLERAESRMVLGRCPSLAVHPAFEGIFFHLSSARLEEQLAQIAEAFPLDFSRTIFTRCVHCNLPLEGPLPLDAVRDRVPEKVREWRTIFFRCPGCARVYWEGTHTERIRAFLAEYIR